MFFFQFFFSSEAFPNSVIPIESPLLFASVTPTYSLLSMPRLSYPLIVTLLQTPTSPVRLRGGAFLLGWRSSCGTSCLYTYLHRSALEKFLQSPCCLAASPCRNKHGLYINTQELHLVYHYPAEYFTLFEATSIQGAVQSPG